MELVLALLEEIGRLAQQEEMEQLALLDALAQGFPPAPGQPALPRARGRLESERRFGQVRPRPGFPRDKRQGRRPRESRRP